MICYYKENWYSIYNIEDFKELMDENVYDCLIDFIKNEYEEKIEDSEQELSWAKSENDDLQYQIDELTERIEELEEQLNE